MNEKKNVVKAKVFSATEIDLDLKKIIENSLSEKIKKNISLDYEINSEILGGVKAVVGNFVFESTVLNNLNRIKNLD